MNEKNTGYKGVKRNAVARISSTFIKHGTLAGCAFLLASITFVLTMDKVIMPLYQRSGREIEAPDLLGVMVDEAKKIASSKKLSLIMEPPKFNNIYPKDTVSFQFPAKGTVIKPGRRILVKISKGPVPMTVPDVVGKSSRDARLAIQAAGLFVSEEAWKPSNDFLYGIVAEQDPKGGEEVPENTGVILYISNGEKETNIIMPDLRKLSLAAALDTLRAYSFDVTRVRMQREEQPDLLPNSVIEQYPDPGLPANTDDEVVLIVSTSE